LGGIEGLRALAALAVVVFHVWDEATLGPNRPPISGDLAANLFGNMRIGVTLFFVLSGFLLYRPHARATIRRTRPPSTKRYLINRGLRILPAYWVILAVTALTVDRELITRPAHLAANAFLVQNYVPPAQPVGWSPLGVAPAWSVVIEVSFYLALPLLGLLALRAAAHLASPVTAALAPPALMLVAGISAHTAYRLHEYELGRTWEKFLIFNYADWFAIGMFLAVAGVLWDEGRLRLPRWWTPVAAVAALCMTAGSAKLWFQGTLLWNEYQAVVAVAIGLLLTFVVLAEPRARIVRALDWRPLLVTGLASYSIFLWNDPVIRALRGHGLQADSAGSFLLALAVVLVVVGALSTVTYLYVERPALALKPAARPAEPSTDAEPFGAVEEADLGGEPQVGDGLPARLHP
jgi:peptidoglycan/LPS O-acetylase OafA/YrhL